MGTQKRFTFEERKKIEEFLKLGLSIPKIGFLLNRSRFSVRHEIDRFGKIKAYKADFAQAETDRRKKARAKSLGEKLKVRPTQLNILTERISNLEQQIDIILDLIKKECNYDSKKN